MNLNKILLTLLLLIPGYVINSQISPKREMRAVWIATVGNIDWPTTKSLTTVQQQTEFIRLLDEAKAYHLNTIVLQIRPAADAFYSSGIEPWSHWLSGTQGKAPSPYYDPLEFAISECRKRGLDIHVWLNPYRAIADTSNKAQDSLHITRIHPEWFLIYGKTLYFNPGLQETRDYVSRIVADIVKRYNIDAVHMDDYFYPYRIKDKEFPDSAAFAEFPRGFSPDKKDDWRRDNVNLIIKQIHDSIQNIKPWVEFGISPFGVWRNAEKDKDGSNTKAGQTNYDDLYADILLWQKEKWIDYVTPQIYWEMGKKIADYTILAEWWAFHNFGTPLYIGHGIYRIDTKAKEKSWRTSREIIRQIKMNRSLPSISGSFFFSGKVLAKDPLNLKRRMLKGPYEFQAIPPVNHRVTQIKPVEPLDAKITRNGMSFTLQFTGNDENKSYVIYRFRKNKPAIYEDASSILTITNKQNIEYTIDKKTNPDKYYFAVSAISKSNQESIPVLFK